MYRQRTDGRKVDEEGFITSSQTPRSPWFCVAVKDDGNQIHVRDTKDGNKTTLSFSRDEWGAFIKGVKRGEFDLS